MHYTALDLQSADRIRFRYKLEGLDADWVDAGTRRTAFYNYVPPGDYTFRVAACNRSGAWSEKPASISISVSPYVWQNWWAIGGVTTALLAAFGGTIRLIEGKRSRLRLERIEHERALERERTRIARDLHDEMGAKLCRISFLSEHARNNTGASADAQRQIASISEASREVLHSLDQIVWAVNPKNDSLEHLVSYVGQYVQDYFSMTGIECCLDVAPQFPPYPLPSQVRHHLFLAAREALTNILKHSGATQARIRMFCEHSTFIFTAADNGAGFDPESASTPDAGNGLRNMQQRLEVISGSCTIVSIPRRGTTVTLKLPLRDVNAPTRK
jgi:signal transduction histidine kinase